jgi:hypothetical protein
MRFGVLFMALSAVFAAANLFCVIFFYKKPAQAFTKICIMPFLALYYVFSARTLLVTAAAAAVLSWLGDILLVQRRGGAAVTGGIAAFFCGNVCCTVSISRFAAVTGGVYPPFAAVYFVFALTLLTVIPWTPAGRGAPRVLTAAAVLYGASLLTLAFYAALLFHLRGDAASAVIFAGALCLTVSDIILAYAYRCKSGRRANFFVMLFYIAAQFCLLPGLAALPDDLLCSQIDLLEKVEW